MNSLKAFKRIMTKYGKTNTLEGTYNDFLTIKKDLEVLEHLKLLFNGYKMLEKIGIKYEDMYLLCKNGDDDLIKEWLEDE